MWPRWGTAGRDTALERCSGALNARALGGLRGLGRAQQGVQTLGEEVGVAGPARRDVAAVLDDERGRVVVARAALGRARAALELARVVERGADLVLDVGRIGPVVAAEPPGGERGTRRAPCTSAGTWCAGPCSTLRPVPGRACGPARARRGRSRRPGAPAPRTRRPSRCSTSLPRYWRMPGAWPPARSSPSKAAGSIVAPGDRRVERRAPRAARGRTRSARARRRAGRRARRSSRSGSHAGRCRRARWRTRPRGRARSSRCHGTATSVTSKSRSGSGTSTRIAYAKPTLQP